MVFHVESSLPSRDGTAAFSGHDGTCHLGPVFPVSVHADFTTEVYSEGIVFRAPPLSIANEEISAGNGAMESLPTNGRWTMRRGKFLSSILLIFFAVAIRSTAWGQFNVGPFEITGFYQYTVDTPTEHANPNNFACLSFIVGPFKCSPGLQKRGGKPDFLLMRQLLDVNIFGKFNENWSATFEPRLFFDMTKIADNHFRQYESLPTPFAGNGWMLRGGGNDFKAEMWQAYTDYRNGGWWVRLGKQQIAWGEALGLRVLDTVNPLDLSQNLSTDRIFEEFDRVRIPQWFARADYGIGISLGVNLAGCLFPVLPAASPCVLLKGEHPRIYIVGGSANYNWTWAGAVLRAETTVTPNAPFADNTAGTPTKVVDRSI